MDSVKTKLEKILMEMGYQNVTNNDGEVVKVEEKYTMDLSILNKLNLTDDNAQKYVSSRRILYKDEYHNEEYTQVQATLYMKKTGLGMVKKIAQEVIDAYVGEAVDVKLKPEFIYLVVPAIEMIVKEKRIAAGGLVRPEELKKAGINPNEYCVCAISFIVESFAEI